MFMLSIRLNALPDSFGIAFFARFLRFFLEAAAGSSVESFSSQSLHFLRALRFFGAAAACASPEEPLEPFVFFQLAEASSGSP